MSSGLMVLYRLNSVPNRDTYSWVGFRPRANKVAMDALVDEVYQKSPLKGLNKKICNRCIDVNSETMSTLVILHLFPESIPGQRWWSKVSIDYSITPHHLWSSQFYNAFKKLCHKQCTFKREKLQCQHWSYWYSCFVVFTLEASRCTGSRCDFVCDCSDCSDEQDCGEIQMHLISFKTQSSDTLYFMIFKEFVYLWLWRLWGFNRLSGERFCVWFWGWKDVWLDR